jgi:hypothetical protein
MTLTDPGLRELYDLKVFVVRRSREATRHAFKTIAKGYLARLYRMRIRI